MSSAKSNSLAIPYKNLFTTVAQKGYTIAIACAIFSVFGFGYIFTIIGDSRLTSHLWLAAALQTLGLGANVEIATNLIYLVLFPTMTFGFWGALYLKRHLSDSSIRITADTILFPPCFALSMRWRRQRLWSDLSHVSLKDKGARLVLNFKSGGSAVLNLRRIAKNQLEQLALAVEMRAAQAARNSPKLALLLDSLHNEKRQKGDLSFTQIWEEQMNSHYSSVGFVPLEPGQSLQDGRFKILRQISFGGLSAVYLAQSSKEDRVVIKESAIPGNVNPSRKAKAEEMLRREAQILIKLSHPQIVRVQDCFVENGKTYLVLHYLPGENLRQIIRQKGPVSESLAIDWARQLGEIIDYLHSQDPPIIHRDISPDNIILGTGGKLILIDFGAANEFLVTATGTLVGKQAYIAPEQFKGKAIPSSDIYALGATLHFILTGNDPEPLSQSNPKNINDSVSINMDDLVFSCTSLEVDKRTQSAKAFLAKINGLISENSKMISLEQKVKS